MKNTGCILLLGASALAGCATLKHTAVDQLGNALASGGTTFAADDDPQLIAAAAPFSLKLMESLLAERPQHAGLLLAATSGFTQYAFAFVQQEADEREDEDFAGATALRARARKLYLRARGYGLRGLEVAHRGFSERARLDPRAAVRVATKADVPLLYWTGAAWAAAISLSKDNPEIIAELPIAEALIDRAFELDESFDRGALHGFLITYEMSRVGGVGDPAARSRDHFNRAVALAHDQLAAPYVAFAEAVCVQKQDIDGFKTNLQRALAIDGEAAPQFRLVNLTMQRRARWLLARTDQLFLPKTPATP